MRQELIELANTYKQAGDAIHDAIRKSIANAGGFLNCSNNKFDRKDILVMVYDKKKGYTETFPIRAMRVSDAGQVEVYVGTAGAIYTDKYLRGRNGEEHWMPLKGSSILFYQTILSIAGTIDIYLDSQEQ